MSRITRQSITAQIFALQQSLVDREKICEQCGAAFFDSTKNLSSRRCSRACTIRWSNKQRLPRWIAENTQLIEQEWRRAIATTHAASA